MLSELVTLAVNGQWGRSHSWALRGGLTMAAPRHEKGLGENNFCVLGQQAGKAQCKSRAIFWQRSHRQHKQRRELLVGYTGRRKNLLKAAFGESLHSLWGYQGDLRNISCLGCELPCLQQPQVLHSRQTRNQRATCSHLTVYNPTCSA